VKLRSHGHLPGGKPTPTYNSWRNMRDRCSNPRSDSYKYYGGAGITFDPAWDDFAAFLHDMGERPCGKTLDRKDPTGNYEKSNCCWSSEKEQQNNRTNNVRLTALGRTLTVAQWAEMLGMTHTTILRRIREGASHEEALRPARSYQKKASSN
jgi:hypothetical protein